MSERAPITVEHRAGITTIRLSRPASANAIDLDVALALREAVSSAGSARVVLLRSSGRIFSVGGDLRTLAGDPEEVEARVQATTSALHDAVLTFDALDAPVIVEVQGPAAGAAVSLVAGADLVVAGSRASFTFGYTAAGLSPDGGASYFLPRLIGVRRAYEFAVSNRTVDAEEALRWGLITHVAEDDSLQALTDRLAAELAAGPTGAYGAIKSLLNAGQRRTLQECLSDEAALLSARACSRDAKEGIAAFLERRPPHFDGT
ncbi:MAG: Enoyl-CoA hydratase/isomerase [Solirubrobacterales bacterium]|nr:Enoyl-CoA hydratase/isomerase [Solirubrobacterales bacterium]